MSVVNELIAASLPAVMFLILTYMSTIAPDELLLYQTGVLSFMILLYGYLFFRSLNRVMIIRGTPTAKVRSAPQSYVELIGTAELLPVPLLSPYTKTPCCWYSYTITSDRTVYSDCSQSPILLRDDSGLCLLLTKGAEISGMEEIVSKGTYSSPYAPSDESRADNSHDQRKSYQHTEKIIKPGAPLYAIGRFYSASKREQRKKADEAAQVYQKKLDAINEQRDNNKGGSQWIPPLPFSGAYMEKLNSHAINEINDLFGVDVDVDTMHYMQKPQSSRLPYIISARSEGKLLNIYGGWRLFFWLMAFLASVGTLGKLYLG